MVSVITVDWYDPPGLTMRLRFVYALSEYDKCMRKVMTPNFSLPCFLTVKDWNISLEHSNIKKGPLLFCYFGLQMIAFSTRDNIHDNSSQFQNF